MTGEVVGGLDIHITLSKMHICAATHEIGVENLLNTKMSLSHDTVRLHFVLCPKNAASYSTDICLSVFYFPFCFFLT